MRWAVVVVAVLCACCDLDQPIGAEVAEPTAGERVLNSIGYVRDPRTNLCFAFRWGVPYYDGPSLALATVPCEAIPPALLQIPRPGRN
jgi:hypothetical protein